MATKIVCDRCDSEDNVLKVETNVSDQTHMTVAAENKQFHRDLCGACRILFKQWFSNIHK